MKKILHWTPRILSILIVIWWILFVFGSHGISVVSLIESIVWIILLVVTLIAWKWERIGGLIFIFLGLLYTVLFWGRGHWTVYLLVSGPLVVTGGLFIADELIKRTGKKKSKKKK